VVIAVAVVMATAVPARANTRHGSPAETKRKELLDKLGIKPTKKQPPPEPEEPPEPEAPEPDSPAPKPDAPPDAPPESGTPPAADASAPVTVYAGKIHRMMQAGCASCHKAGGSAASTRLVLTGSVANDYRVTRKLVDPRAPDASLLLTKSAGKAHLGGAPFPAGGSKYKALRDWIADGATRGGSGTTTPAPVPTPVPPVTAAPAPPVAPAPTAPRKAGAPKSQAKVTPEPALPASGDAGVEPSSAPPRPFAPHVHAILLATCKSCHGTGALAGQGPFSLSGDVQSDYQTSIALVDVAAPASSRLLTKASGREHAGGATLPTTSAGYGEILAWIQDGARGPTAADIAPDDTTGSDDVPIAVDATTGASPPPQTGQRLGDGTPLPEATSPNRLPFEIPFHLRLNGKFDFSYEHRNWKNHPFQTGKSAFQTYHHFLFLSRSGAKDPFGLNVELVTQAFYEFNARVAPKGRNFDFLFKAGKILVPFGNEPLFHKSYGGRSGFDQEILPIIWAQPGVAATAHVRAGPVSFSNDIYTVQGFALRAPDTVLNLQSDVSGFDNFRAAFGDRVGVSWQSLTGWYSVQFNRLGFDRRLFLQAFDLELWRPRGITFVEDLVFGLGGMRADISGGGPGQDYYHFGTYALLGYYPINAIYLQYRAGLRTTDNRRGFYYDPSRKDERDRSSHNVSILGRYKGFYGGLQLFWNLEKAAESDDDFLRVTLGYEF
jgi:mono/diheme cytochrome c family protein